MWMWQAHRGQSSNTHGQALHDLQVKQVRQASQADCAVGRELRGQKGHEVPRNLCRITGRGWGQQQQQYRVGQADKAPVQLARRTARVCGPRRERQQLGKDAAHAWRELSAGCLHEQTGASLSEHGLLCRDLQLVSAMCVADVWHSLARKHIECGQKRKGQMQGSYRRVPLGPRSPCSPPCADTMEALKCTSAGYCAKHSTFCACHIVPRRNLH